MEHAIFIVLFFACYSFVCFIRKMTERNNMLLIVALKTKTNENMQVFFSDLQMFVFLVGICCFLLFLCMFFLVFLFVVMMFVPQFLSHVLLERFLSNGKGFS